MIGTITKVVDYAEARDGISSKGTDNTSLIALLMTITFALTVYVAWYILKFIFRCIYWICLWFYYLIFPNKNPVNKSNNIDGYVAKSGRVYR